MRATGIVHFDPSYKDMPFERRGFFKWTPNAMYTFAIAVFFGFAISAGSKAMLYLLLIPILACGYIISVQKKRILKLSTATVSEDRNNNY